MKHVKCAMMRMKVFLHLLLNCRELEDFNYICRRMIEMLSGEQNEKNIEWKKVVMLGVEDKCKNKS